MQGLKITMNNRRIELMKKDIETRLHSFKENGKVGFKNDIDEIVIPCQWLLTTEFIADIAIVKNTEGMWGIINQKGETVIPFLYANPFIPIEHKVMIFYENGKRIYKNLHGKEIPPHLWKSVNTFHEGLVTVVDENDHYGFADEEGNLVFPPKWEYACYFEKGYAYVKDGDHHFFMNHEGELFLTETPLPYKPAPMRRFDYAYGKYFRAVTSITKFGLSNSETDTKY